MWVAQGLMAPSTLHDAFPSIMRVGKGERISQVDSRSLVLLSCAQTSSFSSFALEVSASFQIPSSFHSNGIQPLRILLPIGERHREAKVAARMVVAGVRLEDTVWSHSAWRLVACQVHLLLLLCHVWARAPVLLLLHVVGDLWPSAPSPFIALHHAGGDLCPPLGYAAVGTPVLALPCVALFQKKASPIGGYYFQHRTKGPAVYIIAITLGKWDRWRDDWVIMQAEVHDRLELMTTAAMGRHSGWERVPNLQSSYRPMLKRI
jgi:hypothetical protein